MVRRGCIVTLVALPLAHAFSFPSPRARWSLPTDPTSTTGLGRSIAYAVDPGLCSQLQPMFVAEQDYFGVACSQLDATIGRVLASWSANNKHVSFYNVTAACIAQEQGPDCSVAELYFTARPPATTDELRRVANTKLTTTGTPAVSTATGSVLPSGEVTITRADVEIFLHRDMCWYLDTNICGYVLRQAYDVEALIVVMYWLLFLTGLCLLAWRILLLARKLAKDAAWKRVDFLVDALLDEFDNALLVDLMAVLIIFPNIFYFKFVQQCFRCYPFAPAILHQVGAALGLGDLSAEGATQLALKPNVTLGVSNCASASLDPTDAASLLGNSSWSAWSSTERGSCTATSWWACDERSHSAMMQPSPLQTSACPQQDDLDALNVLYPPCTATRNAPPLCVPTARNAAWLRMVLQFGVPMVIIAVLFPAVVAIGRVVQRRLLPGSEDVSKSRTAALRPKEVAVA